MEKLTIYGPKHILETIRAVWQGQGLRFELEGIENFVQPPFEDTPAEFPMEAELSVGADKEEPETKKKGRKK